MIRIRAFLFFLSLVSASVNGYSQGCDEKVIEKGRRLDALGYKPRSPQARCEGLYIEDVAGVTLDLMSLTTGRVTYKLLSDEVIYIHAPSGMSPRTGWIRGTSFRANPKYRLDMTWNEKKDFVQVPVKDVLNEATIPCTDVGFFGYVSSKDPKTYYPVTITSKFYKTPESKKIYAVFLSNVDLDGVRYRIAEKVNGINKPWGPVIKLRGFDANDPIEVEITTTTPGKQLCLSVEVLPAGDTEWELPKEYTILIP